MIPRILHSFKRIDPDSLSRLREIKKVNSILGWKQKLWTLEDVKILVESAPQNFKNKFNEFVESGKIIQAEDIAKFIILLNDGGMFLDDGFSFMPNKNIKSFPVNIREYDLVLFTCGKTTRIQESVMASVPNQKFIRQLIDYVGHQEFLPISPWDGRKLDIYSATYLTTQYYLYLHLENNKPSGIEKSIGSFTLAEDIKIPEKEIIIPANFAFKASQSLVIKHHLASKYIPVNAPYQ